MRRTLIALAIAAVAAAAPARGEDWPARTVRIVVGFGPGGGADIVGRIVAQALQEKLGQAFVIENKPGSAGTLGNELVARADKDGYTLGIMTAGQIIAATINKGLRYNTLTAFEPVSQLATASLLIVARPDFPANDVKGLIAEAKAKPDKIVFASAGVAIASAARAAATNALLIAFSGFVGRNSEAYCAVRGNGALRPSA